jgi:N-acetylglucosamine-6-phosphate deacetylase
VAHETLAANLAGRGFARVEWADGHIEHVAIEGPERAGAPLLAPGLIDIQLNGFAGVNFSDPRLTVDDALATVAPLAATGVTAFCPTLVTNSIDALARNFRVLEQARAQDRRFARMVPCYHLEGPYLSPGAARGVHEPAFMHAPDWSEFARLQEAAGGAIGVLTLAPEWPGSAAFIERTRAGGVVVAIGHSDGGARDVHAAAEAGAQLCTHLGNGCGQVLDRHANPLWAQLVRDELSASIICDGFHLPPEPVQVIWRMKGPRRTILVTDAMHVTTLAPGRYSIVGIDIDLLPSGKVVKSDGACLAGSALTMNRAVTKFMELSGASLADALDAASAAPARLLARDTLCAAIAPGQPASFLVARPGADALDVEAVYVQGERVR